VEEPPSHNALVRYRPIIVLMCAIAALAIACSPNPAPASSPAPAGSPAPGEPVPTTPAPTSGAASEAPEVTPNPVGFAFFADDVLAYYESAGYACTGPSPSAEASGYSVRTCSLVDPAGRTRTVGFVTNPSGALGNAFASVAAADGEDLVDPVVALDPLSGFLGAMLGSQRGGTLVEWLAGHAGDAYAETADGGLRIATYTPAEDDLSTIYVELADQAYLDAPRP
jgi:hypothetical protein